MSGCTETGKPLIAVLMAVYNPRMDWLREQLRSLNAQTCAPAKLYVWDDCSPGLAPGELESCVRECVTAFPFEIRRGEKNLGSNAAFAQLTEKAEGDLFAYCDQDDIWLPEKLETLSAAMEKGHALLVCSDMYVIDGEGRTVAAGIRQVRRHHVFLSGEGLAEKLLFRNFVTGCTMLVRAEEAKAALPFCPYMVHDHYLALWCAERGTILSLPQPLIRYRIHGGNQTSMLAGVKDKASYEKIRIEPALRKMLWLQSNFPCGEELRRTIGEGAAWLSARQSSWEGRGGARTVWKYRRFSSFTSAAEIVLKRFPDRLFMKAVSLARENRV